jgi:hypothetical protein
METSKRWSAPLMRVLGGGKVTRQEVEDLTFDATGDLQLALNEAFIRLLEFAYDCDAQCNDRKLEMRLALQNALDDIVRLSDPDVSSN